jgi:hexosaminidase
MKHIWFGILAIIFSCSGNKEEKLSLSWSLDRNYQIDGRDLHDATFTIRNAGGEIFIGKDKFMHWNQAPRWVVETDGPGVIKNINGDFYQLKFDDDFQLEPNDSVKITYTSSGSLIKESDGPLGTYWADISGQTQSLSCKISPFKLPEQYTRTGGDKEPYPSPEYLYERNAVLASYTGGNKYPFIPSPNRYQLRKEETFIFSEGIKIGYDLGLINEAEYLVKKIRDWTGLQVELTEDTQLADGIQLTGNVSLPAENYRLDIHQNQIRISGGDAAGVFYGIQSLLNMCEQVNGRLQVSGINVADGPAFPYRGFHLDVGRNFQSKESVKKLLEVLALNKINQFLFYLTEDEGWRLEIKALPELTEVGAFRGHTSNDSLFLQPSYGSGPDSKNMESMGNGYYTQEDFKEIIQFAHSLHINVIPQFNLPGHARAAIKAMELRYERLMKAGKQEEAERYRLIDPKDTSKYISAQGYFDNTVCVCIDQPLDFYELVIDEVIEMYREAEVPLTMIHTGGDEVPSTAWTGSPLCEAYLRDKPEVKTTRNLQGIFFAKLNDLISSRGLLTGAWEEAVMSFNEDNTWNPNPLFVQKNVFPYIWNNLWGQQDLGYRLANAGYPVILCNVTNFYFDLAYNKDPREPGLYWGGFVDTEDAFSFVPYHLFESTISDPMGNIFDPEKDFIGMEGLEPGKDQNIYGLQAQLWGETVKGQEMMEYYTLPKLHGFAQRAWQGTPVWAGKDKAERYKDYGTFLKTLSSIALPMLDKYNGGYHYRIPPPGIKIIDSQVHLNTEYPGYTIRYTRDNRHPNGSDPIYSEPFEILPGEQVTAAVFNQLGRMGFVSTINN